MCVCGDGPFVSVPLLRTAGLDCGDGPFGSVPLFTLVDKQGDRYKRTVPQFLRPLVYASG